MRLWPPAQLRPRPSALRAPRLTSLVDGVLGHIGHVVSHVLERRVGGVRQAPLPRGAEGPASGAWGRLQRHRTQRSTHPSYRVTTRSEGNGLHMMAGDDL